MAATLSSDETRRFADLRTRILTGVAAAAVGLALVWLGGVWTMLLVAVAAGAMIWEFRSITLRGGDGDATVLLAGVVGGVLAAGIWSWTAGFVWLGWSLAAAAVADLAAGRRQAMGWGVAGGAYIGAAGIGLLYLRAMEPHGFIAALWVFLVVWRRMWGAISPGG